MLGEITKTPVWNTAEYRESQRQRAIAKHKELGTFTGQFVGGTKSIGHKSFAGKMKQELDKCALLCANCHRERHAKEKGLL